MHIYIYRYTQYAYMASSNVVTHDSSSFLGIQSGVLRFRFEVWRGSCDSTKPATSLLLLSVSINEAEWPSQLQSVDAGPHAGAGAVSGHPT